MFIVNNNTSEMWVLWRLKFSKRKIKEKASLGDGMVKIFYRGVEIEGEKDKTISQEKRFGEKKKNLVLDETK